MKVKIYMIGIIVILAAGLVSAIGIGSSYSPEIPLEMYPGQEQTIFLKLENFDVEEGVSLEGTILEGSEIASLDKGPYDVAFEDSVRVKMNVKVPESASVGQKYSVVYEFVQVSSESEGEGAAFIQGIRRGFDVVVVEKPTEPEVPEPGLNWLLWLVIIILIVIVIWWFIKRKKSVES